MVKTAPSRSIACRRRDLPASLASPRKSARISSGSRTSASNARIAAMAAPIETPGWVSNDTVIEGNWSLWRSHMEAWARVGRITAASGTWALLARTACALGVPPTKMCCSTDGSLCERGSTSRMTREKLNGR